MNDDSWNIIYSIKYTYIIYIYAIVRNYNHNSTEKTIVTNCYYCCYYFIYTLLLYII